MPGTALETHIFGIRHHGPGSARSLVNALQAVRPDAVLIEGPPDANELLPLAAHAQLEPPVALLIYVPEVPRNAVLYPFADYSPEWQAIRFALSNRLPVRFIDLPQSLQLRDGDAGESNEDVTEIDTGDPLAPMAFAAGYNDVERWWDAVVESRSGQDLEVFQATHEMISEIRRDLATPPPLREQRREAHMRRCIRDAVSEGHTRIAVVCGAWHTPALASMPSAKSDDALLKGLRKVKTSAAWVPWSYERLSYRSGYGAGVESPVWYELLWQRRPALGAEWLARAARLLREEDIPISSAHIIEGCRLAEALAAVRGRPVPGLPEYNDAAVSVLGSGDALNLRVISHRWHFGGRLGKVPEEFPAAPLQQDLAVLQKRLRFLPKAEEKMVDLDLRETIDRERSQLLRRLRLLGIDWGVPATHRGGRGTFHEVWRVRWKPEFAIALIETSRYGHTVQQASAALVVERSTDVSATLADLIALLEDALFAELAGAIDALVTSIQNRAAMAADILQLLDALPPLVNVHRYGNVRETDLSLVAAILAGLVPRMLVGIGPASRNIDDDAARVIWQKLAAADGALATFGDEGFSRAWQETLAKLAQSEGVHPLIAGYAHRLLYDARLIDFEELSRAFSLSLSQGNAPALAAAWVEGLLSGSGSILIHDDRMRTLIDDWIRTVRDEHFIQVLPLLRRTFAQFPPAERRQIGERMRARTGGTVTSAADTEFDEAAAKAVLPVLRLIWNIEEPHS